MPQAQSVILCLDNDKAGRLACERMTGQLEAQGLEVLRQAPTMKDWNDDLLAQHQNAMQLAAPS